MSKRKEQPEQSYGPRRRGPVHVAMVLAVIALILIPPAFLLPSLVSGRHRVDLMLGGNRLLMTRMQGPGRPGIGVVDLKPASGRCWLFRAGRAWQYFVYFGPQRGPLSFTM